MIAWHVVKLSLGRCAAPTTRCAASRHRSDEASCDATRHPARDRHRLRSAVLAVWLGALSLAGLGLPNAALSQTVLKASPLGPPNHLLNAEVLRGWAEAVAQATQGRVRIEVLAQAVAPPPKVLGAVRNGAADVAILSTGASETPLPLNRLVEFAGQTVDAERASLAYQRVAARFPMVIDEFGGVDVLGVFTHGPGALLLSERGVALIETLPQATLHAGSNGAADVARALGAKVVRAPGPAAKGLLADGRVDGTITAIETLQGFDLLPHIRRVVVMPGGFYAAGFALIVNHDRWVALPAADRDAIVSVSGEAFDEALARRAGQAWDRADAEAIRVARLQGVPVVEASPEMVKKIRSASLESENAWISGMGVLGTDARNALTEYRELERSPPTGSAR